MATCQGCAPCFWFVCCFWLKLIYKQLNEVDANRYTCNSTESINAAQGITDENFFCKPYVNYTVSSEAVVKGQRPGERLQCNRV